MRTTEVHHPLNYTVRHQSRSLLDDARRWYVVNPPGMVATMTGRLVRPNTTSQTANVPTRATSTAVPIRGATVVVARQQELATRTDRRSQRGRGLVSG